jgi:Putative phage metallopeptidase
MPKVFEKVEGGEIPKLGQSLIDKHYPDINQADLTIDYLLVSNGEGQAIMHHGYPALGLCRIVSLKDRAKGMADVEIQLDHRAWTGMTKEQKAALLDHELNHVIIVRGDENEILTDDLNRPKVKMRKHDFQFGWFTAIADRHGMNSPEVTQAKILWDEAGQSFFPMLTEAK